MKDIEPPDLSWEERMTCQTCQTSFTAEPSDLEGDHFKRPGTYWFDGSAQAAGTIYRLFVWCPNRCDLLFPDEGRIPELLRRAVRNKSAGFQPYPGR